MKSPFLLTLLLSFPGIMNAQNQNNIWYFGNKAGLDFNVDPPASISSSLITLEGTASVSDPEGSLLFYSNGVTVWDRNHNIMPNGNGLVGGESSTQSALIVPLPNSCSKYYLFTTEDHFSDGGLAYSIVDMCLNGGLGDIVTASKNTPVVNQTTEKITAVLHSNGVDIWILTHTLNSNRFLAYLLSSTGLNTLPVISSIGSFYSTTAIIGPIKASHDGTKIVSSASFHDICEMFDFDASTGKLTNFYNLNQYFSGKQFVYGIEFSPNNKILYLSTFFVVNYLYQLDLETEQLITLNSISGNYHYGALQMGPDKKIYMARNESDFIDVIHQPNRSGTSCQYDEGGQSLLNGTFSQTGLPNIAPYSFLPDTITEFSLGNDTTLCMGDSIILTPMLPSNCPVNFLWNDGSTDPDKVIKQPGTYWIEIENACYFSNDTIQISVTPLPEISFNDSLLCEGETIHLDASIPDGTYLWSDGSTDSFLMVEEVGTYWVELTNSCSVDTAFITINTVPYPFISIQDTLLCTGETITIDAFFPGSTYLWSDNSTQSSNEVGQDGVFWVQINNSCYTHTDSFLITVIPVPNVALPDTNLCLGDSLILDAFFPGTTYLWSDGTMESSLSVKTEGQYWVELTNFCFIEEEFITVSTISDPEVDFVDTILCDGHQLELDATYPGAQYVWSDHSTRPLLIVDHPGNYWVEVTNLCGKDTAFVSIASMDCDFKVYIPNVFTPNEDGYNDFIKPVVNTELLIYTFMIFDRWGDCVYISTDNQESWDGLFRNKRVSPGVYAYRLDCESILGIRKQITGDITLVR